jgi:hypothetical protein
MRISIKALAVGLFIALTPALASAQAPAAAPASAVKLEAGTWTGQVTTPNGQTVDVTYDVAVKNDTVTVTINAGQFGSFPAQALKFEADKFSFNFTPGPTVECVMKKQPDGTFAGDCLDDSGAPAHMTWVAPKKAGTTGS